MTDEEGLRRAKALATEAMNWAPTHVHVKTGSQYRVTCDTRLEVTHNDALRLVDYDTREGAKFAQSYTRFHDGRFRPITRDNEALLGIPDEALLLELIRRNKVQHAPHTIRLMHDARTCCIGIGKGEHADILISIEGLKLLEENTDAF